MADYRLTLRGDIDLAASRALLHDLQRAIECSLANVVVDCTDVTRIDPTGLYVVLQARRALERQGRQMHILNAGEKQRRAFELVGQTDILSEDFGLERTRI